MDKIRAYPRWRGEHISALPPRPTIWGLPPLARGAQHPSEVELDLGGPTPAGAGSAATAIPSPLSPAAYPRWRGEHTCPTRTRTP